MLIKVAEPSTPTGTSTGEEGGKEGEAVESSSRSSALDPRKVGLEKEIAEAKEMMMLAHSPQIKASLSSLLTRLEKDLHSLPPSAPPSSSSSSSSAPAPKFNGSTPSALLASLQPAFTSIDSYGWDQGEYNSPWISVYVTLPGVGNVKEGVSCSFTPFGFDLKIEGLDGKNYRLVKDNLEKGIVVEESKWKVKENKVVVMLRKKKGEFGSFDHWMDLTAKKKVGGGGGEGGKEGGGLGGGMGGLMDVMKQMYEEGDDTIKKTIAESMMKVQRGDRSGSGMPEFGGGGGMGGGLGGGMEEMDDFL